MKSRVFGFLFGTVLFLCIASCATVPMEPLTPGQVRLLEIRFPDFGVIKANLQYIVDIRFESEGNPEIKRACFSWTGRATNCFNVTDVRYGSPGSIGVTLRTPEPGLYSVDTFVIYNREGKTVRSNVINAQISVAN